MQLQHVDSLIEKRGRIAQMYTQGLASVPGIRVPAALPDTRANHSYFPIFIGPGFPLSRDAVYELLKERGIFARRYFYPLLSSMPMYRGLASAAPGRLPHALKAASEVLCLPIYPTLGDNDVLRVIETITACRSA